LSDIILNLNHVHYFVVFRQFGICTYVGKSHKLCEWPCVLASRLVCIARKTAGGSGQEGDVLISREGIMAAIV
jgi:hypothetical protein